MANPMWSGTLEVGVGQVERDGERFRAALVIE
jgi:hypothetical protein